MEGCIIHALYDCIAEPNTADLGVIAWQRDKSDRLTNEARDSHPTKRCEAVSAHSIKFGKTERHPPQTVHPIPSETSGSGGKHRHKAGSDYLSNCAMADGPW